jgi:tRNA(Ile2) C34 agmatinyltransferase TiaS
MKTLIWINLKEDYCPKCYMDLIETPEGFKCTQCDFKISRQKYEEILEDLYKEEAGDDAENA